MAHLHQSRELFRVSDDNPCAICGHADWCSYSEDGATAICMRVSDGAVSTTRNNGFFHVLREQGHVSRQQSKPSKALPTESLIAPIKRRHAIYTALLESLTLNSQHADNLLERELSDTEAARNLYSSLPNIANASTICAELTRQFDLTNVPGFYRDPNGRWRLALKGEGFLIPVRDSQGRIQACQIRSDNGEPRYRWFSSRGRTDGASSGAPIHFARAWRVASSGEAFITEGALKADIIAEQLDACIVAVAGVSSFRDDFGEWLRTELPGLQTTLIALDSDWHNNPVVERAIRRLMTSLKKAGFNGGLFDWTAAKGLDDLLRLRA